MYAFSSGLKKARYCEVIFAAPCRYDMFYLTYYTTHVTEVPRRTILHASIQTLFSRSRSFTALEFLEYQEVCMLIL